MTGVAAACPSTPPPKMKTPVNRGGGASCLPTAKMNLAGGAIVGIGFWATTPVQRRLPCNLPVPIGAYIPTRFALPPTPAAKTVPAFGPLKTPCRVRGGLHRLSAVRWVYGNPRRPLSPSPGDQPRWPRAVRLVVDLPACISAVLHHRPRGQWCNSIGACRLWLGCNLEQSGKLCRREGLLSLNVISPRFPGSGISFRLSA